MLNIRQAAERDEEWIAQFDEFSGSRHLEITAGNCYVAEDDDKIVAYVSYLPDGLLGQPFLSYLCVRKSYRKTGIGTKLIKQVMTVAKGRKLISSTEDWCVETQRIFERLGWSKVGAIANINKDGSDEIFYAINIDA